MTEKEEAAVKAANAAIETAASHIKNQRVATQVAKLKLYCLTVFACVLCICAAVTACYAIHVQHETIVEQQYALNMQYAGLMEYIAGAEVTRETVDTGDNGTAFIGDGNTVVGGDLNG